MASKIVDMLGRARIMLSHPPISLDTVLAYTRDIGLKSKWCQQPFAYSLSRPPPVPSIPAAVSHVSFITPLRRRLRLLRVYSSRTALEGVRFQPGSDRPVRRGRDRIRECRRRWRCSRSTQAHTPRSVMRCLIWREIAYALSSQATGPITGASAMMRHRQNQYFLRFNRI